MCMLSILDVFVSLFCLFSFFSMSQEGRIQSVEVYGYQKRYDPEKYYVYILKVKRENQPEPTYLFRLYKEFYEFYQKLCLMFPLAKCHR